MRRAMILVLAIGVSACLAWAQEGKKPRAADPLLIEGTLDESSDADDESSDAKTEDSDAPADSDTDEDSDEDTGKDTDKDTVEGEPADEPVEEPANVELPEPDSDASPVSIADPELEEFMKNVSYLFGRQIGGQINAQPITLNRKSLFSGISDEIDGKESKFSEEEAAKILDRFGTVIKEKWMELGRKNKSEARKFLAENGKKKGVKTTESGLQYKVLKKGKGPSPGATDQVVAHYKGTLLDGKEFDSSYKRGKPAVFPVDQVIGGWTEALQMMKIGDKWELYVPPNLAYGEQGKGQAIPPNAALIFEVELLAIEQPESP